MFTEKNPRIYSEISEGKTADLIKTYGHVLSNFYFVMLLSPEYL